MPVHSCLGLLSYFRRFVSQFSRIARPLQDLLHKDAVFNFDHRCHEAFQKLKNLLVEAPVLAIYNHTKTTELHNSAPLWKFQGTRRCHDVREMDTQSAAVGSQIYMPIDCEVKGEYDPCRLIAMVDSNDDDFKWLRTETRKLSLFEADWKNKKWAVIWWRTGWSIIKLGTMPSCCTCTRWKGNQRNSPYSREDWSSKCRQ